MRTRAIGYARVSTEGQGADGVSLEAQRAKIQAQAAVKDFDLVGIDADIASAKRADNRDGLQRVLGVVRGGQVGAVVVYALDRLTRNLADLQGILDLCERRGVKLVSVSESLDTSSAAGRMVVNLLGVVAQWQREYIGERTAAALSHKRRQGERVSRHLPYGWNLAGNGVDLEPVADEQRTLERMVDLRRRGLSFRQIAGALDADGVRPKRGRRWYASSVRAILDRQGALNPRPVALAA